MSVDCLTEAGRVWPQSSDQCYVSELQVGNETGRECLLSVELFGVESESGAVQERIFQSSESTSSSVMTLRDPPSCLDVSAKASLEILGLLVLIFPMAYVYVISSEYTPYQR